MKTYNLNPQVLNLKFEPSLLKYPVKSVNWEMLTAAFILGAIVASVFILAHIGVINPRNMSF